MMQAVASPEVICAGMVLVDVLASGVAGMPARGETGYVGSITMNTGGDALNEAIALSKLGVAVGLWGLLGDDEQAAFILRECRQHGIDTSGVAVDPARATSTSIVLIDIGGERSFLSHRDGTISAFGPEHVDLSRIGEGLKVFSVGSLFCATRFDREILPAALERARRAGAVTIADLVLNQGSRGLADVSAALQRLDYLVPSQQEAEFYTGEADPLKAARALLDLGAGTVVVKLGADGAIACTADKTLSVAAFSTDVVDTTGAGDNFMAGLVFGLARRLPLGEALRIAAATAALSIQAIGASAGLRSLRQVEEFMTTNSPRIQGLRT